MTRQFGLAFLTVADLPPGEAIRVAAETGYSTVGLRLLPAAADGEGPYPILTDRAVLAEARSALADTGMKVGDVEIVRLKPDTRVDAFLPFLECAQALVSGSTIVLRLGAYFPECRSGCEEKVDCPWPPSIVLGDVKWCRGISDSGPPRFGAGVKFYLQA